jgi:hypothetical protein
MPALRQANDNVGEMTTDAAGMSDLPALFGLLALDVAPTKLLHLAVAVNRQDIQRQLLGDLPRQATQGDS